MPNTKFVFFIAILWTVLIVFLSLMTLGDIGSEIRVPFKDKVVHFILYFVAVCLWYTCTIVKFPKATTKIIVLVSAIAFGVVMELCQGIFTTKRTPDIIDAIANAVGCIFGLLFITTVLNHKTNKSNPT